MFEDAKGQAGTITILDLKSAAVDVRMNSKEDL